MLGPDDVVKDPHGTEVKILEGDLMRINYKQWDDPTSGVTYQYMLAKIAKKESTARLVFPTTTCANCWGEQKITHTPCCSLPNYQMKNILGENYYCQTFAPPVTECLERH